MNNCLEQKIHYMEREMAKLQCVADEKFGGNARHEETQTTQQDDDDMKEHERGLTFQNDGEINQSSIENMVHDKLSTLNDHVDGLEG